MGNKQNLALCGKVCLRCITCQCGPTKEEQELIDRGKKYYKTIDNTDQEYLKLILNNPQDNLELFNRIDSENEKFAAKMRDKIFQLIKQGADSSNPQIIGTGNSCNNPIYIYNVKIMDVCPKCQGRVEEELENGYELKERWDDTAECYRKVKNYNESKICTRFKWNNNIDIWDVDLNECFKHYDKEDPQKKEHITVQTEVGPKEFDVAYHYMMIDGERFDFPFCMNMRSAFLQNEYVFFPKKNTKVVDGMPALGYSHRICFFYEQNRMELGKPIGNYGYAWRHEVYIFTCNSCGYKYHIAKSSPFAFRNKSLDAY